MLSEGGQVSGRPGETTDGILSDVESDQPVPAKSSSDATPIMACPVCGFDMVAIRGSKEAVCSNCGFKDSCCY